MTQILRDFLHNSTADGISTNSISLSVSPPLSPSLARLFAVLLLCLVIEMVTTRYNYLYRQGNSLFFMDPVSFEQHELDAGLAPGKSAHYLIENSSIGLVRDGETFVKIVVPEKIVCTVESTQPARIKQTNDAGGKDAKLTNGLTILVPNHVETGQHIIVNTANDTFVSKSDAPPAPEPEKLF